MLSTTCVASGSQQHATVLLGFFLVVRAQSNAWVPRATMLKSPTFPVGRNSMFCGPLTADVSRARSRATFDQSNTWKGELNWRLVCNNWSYFPLRICALAYIQISFEYTPPLYLVLDSQSLSFGFSTGYLNKMPPPPPGYTLEDTYTAYTTIVADWSVLVSLSYGVATEPAIKIQYTFSPFIRRI